jgi:hypothetical protein
MLMVNTRITTFATRWVCFTISGDIAKLIQSIQNAIFLLLEFQTRFPLVLHHSQFSLFVLSNITYADLLAELFENSFFQLIHSVFHGLYMLIA